MKSKLIIVGGFLGAGKTTLLLKAAERLIGRGYRVGLITNDQGDNLVDTELAASRNIPVTEVAGGCFCCRFPDLIRGLTHLQETVQPDVVLAEPVGSCTDLIATIVRPIERYHSDRFEVAPLTILLDAQRDMTDFSADVAYLYQQQLAEADLLILNKIDQLGANHIEHRLAELPTLAPKAKPLACSGHNGTGISEWLEHVLTETHTTDNTLDLDYQRYAQAEAEMGWLNARGVLLTSNPVSAEGWATKLLSMLAKSWKSQQAPIAHVKMNLQSANGQRHKVSLIQQGEPLVWDPVGTMAKNEMDNEINNERNHQVEFILNVRVGSSPQMLEEIVHRTLDRVKPDEESRYLFAHFECFSPLPPQPTHRI